MGGDVMATGREEICAVRDPERKFPSSSLIIPHDPVLKPLVSVDIMAICSKTVVSWPGIPGRGAEKGKVGYYGEGREREGDDHPEPEGVGRHEGQAGGAVGAHGQGAGDRAHYGPDAGDGGHGGVGPEAWAGCR